MKVEAKLPHISHTKITYEQSKNLSCDISAMKTAIDLQHTVSCPACVHCQTAVHPSFIIIIPSIFYYNLTIVSLYTSYSQAFDFSSQYVKKYPYCYFSLVVVFPLLCSEYYMTRPQYLPWWQAVLTIMPCIFHILSPALFYNLVYASQHMNVNLGPFHNY